MRLVVIPLVGVLLAVAMLGSDSSMKTDDSTECGIEGRWQATGYVVNGSNINLTSPYLLTNCDGRYIFSGEGGSGQGRYRIDPTRQPPHLDRIASSGRNQGKALKFIYRIDGDRLWVAHIAIGEADERRRPQSFDDDGVYIETYKRVK
jgi:uncharacterized protein (TIGR03067 family)